MSKINCYFNGRFVADAEVRISPFNHGFLYGIGFFETFRTYHSTIIGLPDHMHRLSRSLRDLHLHIQLNEDEIQRAAKQLNEYANGKDGYFRLTVYAGDEGMGLGPREYDNVNYLLMRKDLPPVSRGTEKEARILSTIRNSVETTFRHKSLNFINNVKARQEVSSLAQVEGILLNEEGYITEGVTSNLFWVKNGELYTPAVETGLLEGTTRNKIIKLSKEIMKVSEGLYSKEDLIGIDELFATNAVQELIPIRSIHGISLKGQRGPVYQILHEKYRQMIEQEVMENGKKI